MYEKPDSDEWKNVSVMPGQTDRQTDEHFFFVYTLTWAVDEYSKVSDVGPEHVIPKVHTASLECYGRKGRTDEQSNIIWLGNGGSVGLHIHIVAWKSHDLLMINSRRSQETRQPEKVHSAYSSRGHTVRRHSIQNKGSGGDYTCSDKEKGMQHHRILHACRQCSQNIVNLVILHRVVGCSAVTVWESLDCWNRIE